MDVACPCRPYSAARGPVARPTTMASSLLEYLQRQGSSPVKLHLGCGGMRWKDFINVDLYPDTGQVDSSRSGCVADVFADIRKLGLPEASVDEIFTAHTIEHFTRWETLRILQDWHRSLKPGGLLVIEMPDFWRCVLWLFHPLPKYRKVARDQFYGNQWDELEYETHRYVWAAGEVRRVLRELSFSSVRITHRTETHYPGRDMRIEARK